MKKTATLCLLYICNDWFLFIFLQISNNCFIYQLNSSVCLTHFTGYSSSPPLWLLWCPPPPLASQHTAHLLVSLHSHLRAETFKSGSSSAPSRRERERFCDNYCLPVRVLPVRCYVGTLSKLTSDYATKVRIFGQSHASYIKIRYILSREGGLVH